MTSLDPEAPPAPTARTRLPLPWWTRPVPAIAFASTAGLALLVAAPAHAGSAAVLAVGYVTAPLGGLFWTASGVALGLPLLLAVLVLWIVDASVSLAVALCVPVERALERIPRLGKRVRALATRLERGRAARWGVAFALAAIVAAPVHAGGAIVGSLAGRAIGLGAARTVAAVAGGAAARALLDAAIVGGAIRLLL